MAKQVSFQPPFRVGRKQKRAVLDANGVEVGIFTTGHEEAAQEYCDYLNNLYSKSDYLNKIIKRGQKAKTVTFKVMKNLVKKSKQ